MMQRAAAKVLQASIKAAGETGLFNELVTWCDNPDSINDVTEALAQILNDAEEKDREHTNNRI